MMDINTLHKKLFDGYEKYCQKGYEKRYLLPDTLKHHLLQKISSDILKIELLGKSFEERDICKVTAGNGKIKVLLWSQMHGDESTATRALFDVFAFFNSSNDEFDNVRELIIQKLALCFVPMLNPDGAIRWQRRTAQDIDMNRDAVRNTTAEGQLLQNLYKEINPDYAFNLHDQASYYTAGLTANPATIALLAPPVDNKDLIPVNRHRSMQLVCLFNEFLQQYIPNCVGKWKDDYEARAFGEHFQSWGAATILIESGGRANDHERNLARKLNFIILITGLYAITTDILLQQDISNYKQIPVNVKENIFDIVYKNVNLKQNSKQYICDIGIRRSDKLIDNELVSSFIIEDIGDLSQFGAFEIVDAKGKQIINKNNMPIMIGNAANIEIKS